MPSISDTALDAGCVTHIGAVHGLSIKILDGPDAGKTFWANVVETEQDIVLNSDLSEDRRAKRIIRFQDSKGVPNILNQGKVEIDGKQWTAVRNPGDGYLTTDFELKQIVQGKDE